MLSREEARLLRLVSVFTGTFTMDDVMGITSGAQGGVAEVAAGIESLVAKSLLSVSYLEGALRYRLLDTTRTFAAAQLATGDEHWDAHERLARYLLAVFRQTDVEWDLPASRLPQYEL